MAHDKGTTQPADAGPVERPVRPLRWLCQSCDWTGSDAELLRAPSPFDAADTIVGCPKCKAVEDIANACDEPGCDQEATCGFPATTPRITTSSSSPARASSCCRSAGSLSKDFLEKHSGRNWSARGCSSVSVGLSESAGSGARARDEDGGSLGIDRAGIKKG